MMRLKQANKLINDKLIINRNFINKLYIQTHENIKFEVLKNKLNDPLLDQLWAKIFNEINNELYNGTK
jgi:hypothetical protein